MRTACACIRDLSHTKLGGELELAQLCFLVYANLTGIWAFFLKGPFANLHPVQHPARPRLPLCSPESSKMSTLDQAAQAATPNDAPISLPFPVLPCRGTTSSWRTTAAAAAPPPRTMVGWENYVMFGRR